MPKPTSAPRRLPGNRVETYCLVCAYFPVGKEKPMQGLLTYRDERLEEFDLISLTDLFFGALGYILEEVSVEIVFELLAAFLEFL